MSVSWYCKHLTKGYPPCKLQTRMRHPMRMKYLMRMSHLMTRMRTSQLMTRMRTCFDWQKLSMEVRSLMIRTARIIRLLSMALIDHNVRHYGYPRNTYFLVVILILWSKCPKRMSWVVVRKQTIKCPQRKICAGNQVKAIKAMDVANALT